MLQLTIRLYEKANKNEVHRTGADFYMRHTKAYKRVDRRQTYLAVTCTLQNHINTRTDIQTNYIDEMKAWRK
jgi:hypothetical protein